MLVVRKASVTRRTHELCAGKAALRAKLPTLATGYCEATTDGERRGALTPATCNPAW